MMPNSTCVSLRDTLLRWAAVRAPLEVSAAISCKIVECREAGTRGKQLPSVPW